LSRVDINNLISEKMADLAGRPAIEKWMACVSVWARLYVLSGAGCRRWPAIADGVSQLFASAMQRSVDPDGDFTAEVPAVPAQWDVEDDGSDEWAYTVDLIEATSPVVEGADLDGCTEVALTTFLDSMFNSRARAYGDEFGRPVSVAEVRERIVNDPAWLRTLEFVSSI